MDDSEDEEDYDLVEATPYEELERAKLLAKQSGETVVEFDEEERGDLSPVLYSDTDEEGAVDAQNDIAVSNT